MPALADVLRTHLDYTAWASRHLVDAAAQLKQDELMRDFRTATNNVLNTLVHVYAADRIWLARLQHENRTEFVSDADHSLAVLQNEWPFLRERWKKWAALLTDEQVFSEIEYTDLKGRSWKQPLSQIILHVVNHGTHHRGQVSGFIRALGQVPPPLDFIAYCREMKPVV
jgi:uncharacterized damage-inducible protein DinB